MSFPERFSNYEYEIVKDFSAKSLGSSLQDLSYNHYISAHYHSFCLLSTYWLYQNWTQLFTFCNHSVLICPFLVYQKAISECINFINTSKIYVICKISNSFGTPLVKLGGTKLTLGKSVIFSCYSELPR